MSQLPLSPFSSYLFNSNRLYTPQGIKHGAIKFSLLAISIILTNQSLAMTSSTEQVIIEAHEKNLAEKSSWKRLLHYPDNSPDNDSNHKIQSRVNNPEFFISKGANENGNSNPQAEMDAMLSALMSDAHLADSSVQCRFPARTYWLKQQLDLSFPKAKCVAYDAWQRKLQPKQMLVMFAQEFPDSMTSAFAHTLLRIDTDSNPVSNHYENSYAINYTVGGDDTDSMPVYAVKSMFGRYPGLMTIDPYLPKLNNYLKKDQRDVWTYPLKLSQSQQQQMVRHIWETKDLGLPYYFLTDNCASEILRLIDVVRPEGQLYTEVSKMAIPSEVVRLLDEQKLLSEGQYLPADKSLEQAKLNINKAFSESSRSNNSNSKHSITDNLSVPLFRESVADNSPIGSYNLQRASIGVGRLGDEHNYIELGARASYHDLLDPTSGYRQNHDMDGLNIKVRAYDNSGEVDSVQLQELTLLRGRSYHPINTARSGGGWGLHVGLKQVMDGSKDFEYFKNTNSLSQQHLVGSIGYEKGVSLAFGQPNSQYELPAHLCYAFAGGTGQFGRGITSGFRVGINGNIGCVYRFSDNFRTKADIILPYWYHGDTDLSHHKSGYWQPTASLGMQYDVTKNQAVRLTLEHELTDRVKDDTDLQVAWQWYF